MAGQFSVGAAVCRDLNAEQHLESEFTEGERCFENRWIGQTDWGARPPLSATLFAEPPVRGHPLDSPLTFVRGCAISALPRYVYPLVAQKQSSRPIIGRPWCNTKRADQFGRTGQMGRPTLKHESVSVTGS